MIELFNDGNISKNNVKLINKLLFLRRSGNNRKKKCSKGNIITDFDTFKKWINMQKPVLYFTEKLIY
jgi:hypothetical protein